MIRTTDRAWAEISLDHISFNYHAMSEQLQPGCQLIAVLKADGYGHGAVAIGRFLEKLGCKLFAVASLEEALELREHGISVPIMLLSPIDPKWVSLALDNRLIVPLVSESAAKRLAEQAQAEHKALHTYIKVDCGLSRFGIVIAGREKLAAEEVCSIANMPGLSIHSLMTHLTAGGVAQQNELNLKQLNCFREFCDVLEQRGVVLRRHCCASRLAVRYSDFQFDYVRIGSNLFGVHPYYGEGPHFRPALQLKARILQIKEVEAGTTVGYGPAYTTKRRSRVAVLPIGYVDGLSCRLGNQMHVLVDGRRVPQIGRLCMDYCMLDVTDVPDVKEGDVVTIFGENGGQFLSVQEHAAIYGGTASELICLLGRRIPRFYFRNGIKLDNADIFGSKYEKGSCDDEKS